MRGMVPWLLMAALPWPAACSVAETFACNDDAQCVTEAAAGRCEAEGVCSFPDGACPSGHRYGGLAGELSGECVGGGASSDGSSDTTVDPGATSAPPVESLDGDSSSGSSPSTASSTSTGEAPDSTSEPPGSTSEPGVETATTTTTTDASSSSGSGPDLDPYGPCMEASDCVEPDSYCQIYNDTTVCVPPCETDEDCPPAPGPTSAALCLDYAGATGCVLVCNEDNSCPDGMRCEPVEMVMGVGYCAW